MITEGDGPRGLLTDHCKSMTFNGNQCLKGSIYKTHRAVASFGARRFLARRVHAFSVVRLQRTLYCHAQVHGSLLAKLGRGGWCFAKFRQFMLAASARWCDKLRTRCFPGGCELRRGNPRLRGPLSYLCTCPTSETTVGCGNL